MKKTKFFPNLQIVDEMKLVQHMGKSSLLSSGSEIKILLTSDNAKTLLKENESAFGLCLVQAIKDVEQDCWIATNAQWLNFTATSASATIPGQPVVNNDAKHKEPVSDSLNSLASSANAQATKTVTTDKPKARTTNQAKTQTPASTNDPLASLSSLVSR